MPLYEYECGACHRRTEKIQKFSDPELTVCLFCGGPLARTVTAPAVQFKGSGWYKDLYSSAKPPATPPATEGTSASPGGSEGATGKAGTTAADTGSKTPSAPPAAAPASAPAPNVSAASVSPKS